MATRTFTVMDVWDALRSDRPYRDAWSRERAIEYIKGQAGRHFDPKVMEAFLKSSRGHLKNRIARGIVSVKSKGEMETWFLVGRKKNGMV